jgi:GDP-L-fucose synthase
MDLTSKKIYIAGHTGMVGSSLMRKFRAENCTQIITRELDELDLTRQEQTEAFFDEAKPEIVIIAAAKVGGIHANNTFRAQFIYENLMIESNVIHAAHTAGVEKLLFLGSSCIYPKMAAQPIREEYLMSGALEYTNEPYAVAKIAGIKMCESYYKQYGSNFYSVMPTNMYGPYDNFNLETSHVFPALIRKVHEAKIRVDKNVEVWGTGKARREFMYVDDLA